MEPRNFLSYASVVPPVKPAAPSFGYPTAAVPGVTPATVPGPFWFYKLGEELRNIITAAGITPSDDSLIQLISALDALFSPIGGNSSVVFKVADAVSANDAVSLGQFPNSFSPSGYQVLPNGLIMQWGQTGPINATTNVTQTLPITFPTAGLYAFPIVANYSSDGNGIATCILRGLTTNQITIRNSDANSQTCFWLAFGY